MNAELMAASDRKIRTAQLSIIIENYVENDHIFEILRANFKSVVKL